MTFETLNKRLPVGTKLQHKRNPRIQGVRVGQAFGTPRKGNFMLQLTCGLQYQVSPYALKEVSEWYVENYEI